MTAADRAADPVQQRALRLVHHRLRDRVETRLDDELRERAGNVDRVRAHRAEAPAETAFAISRPLKRSMPSSASSISSARLSDIAKAALSRNFCAISLRSSARSPAPRFTRS